MQIWPLRFCLLCVLQWVSQDKWGTDAGEKFPRPPLLSDLPAALIVSFKMWSVFPGSGGGVGDVSFEPWFQVKNKTQPPTRWWPRAAVSTVQVQNWVVFPAWGRTS